jgi:hypothetical protein
MELRRADTLVTDPGPPLLRPAIDAIGKAVAGLCQLCHETHPR